MQKKVDIPSKVRIDKYLWAIRIFKTRSIATEACSLNKVKLNAVHCKASRIVALNDVLEIKSENKIWKIKVLKIIENRVSFEIATTCYLDESPEPVVDINLLKSVTINYKSKDNAKGRPTKRDRRNLDKYLSD